MRYGGDGAVAFDEIHNLGNASEATSLHGFYLYPIGTSIEYRGAKPPLPPQASSTIPPPCTTRVLIGAIFFQMRVFKVKITIWSGHCVIGAVKFSTGETATLNLVVEGGGLSHLHRVSFLVAA